MRKNFKYNLIGLALLFVGIVSCDTATQEVSPIVAPDDSYPVVTFTLETPGTTFSELDTIVYTISTNKPIDRALTFRATQTGGTADGDDYTVENATIQPYTTEAQLKIIILEGWSGEANETADFTIALTSLADKYLIAPTSPHETTISFTITNNNYSLEIIDLTTEMPKDGEVWIAFDGDVTYVEGKTITFHDKYYSTQSPDQVVSGDDIIVSGDHVQILHEDFWEWTTIIMTVEAGAFVDAVGNVNEETVIQFPIPFNLYSYAGTVQRTYFNWDATYVTDTVDVSVIDEDASIVGIPDIGFAPMGESELVGDISVFIDVESYKADVLDTRYNLYLNYYNDNDGYGGYYIEDATWFWDPCIEESSQFVIRGIGGAGYFDDTNYSFGVVYSIITELIVGDGSAGTSGLWITTSSETGDHVSKGSLESYNEVHKQLKIVDKVTVNGHVAYKVEL